MKAMQRAPTADRPRVSIVVSCYNYARYVAYAVDSALAQTYPDVEVIVVDDGSTDDSAAILQGFGNRITLIVQANRGHVRAINRGYEASRGDIVLFLDADDALRSDAVARVVAEWKESCTKVQFELDLIDSDGARLGRRFCNYAKSYGPAEIEREFARFGTYVWPVLTGNAYSRWFLEQLMPLTVARAPDGCLNTLAPLYGEIRVVPEALGCYRQHDANLSYHAIPSREIGLRFAQRVALRRSELDQLKEHANIRSIALPPGDLLDYDLIFINYRLMLRRLGTAYEGRSHDSSIHLWMLGMKQLGQRSMPTRMKFGHTIWLTVLLCSPRWFARRLIALRFERTSLLQPMRRKFRHRAQASTASDASVAQPSI